MVWQTLAHQLHVAWGGTSKFTTRGGALQIDKQVTIIIDYYFVTIPRQCLQALKCMLCKEDEGGG